MAQKSPGLSAPSLSALADQLGRAATGASHRLEVPLTAAATGVALLGAPAFLRQALFARFADAPPSTTLRELAELWAHLQKASTYLIGYLTPLIGWLENEKPLAHDTDAFARCAKVLAGVDLAAVAANPQVGGDLLGPLYSMLRAPSSRTHLGAFYTPPDVAMLTAALAGPREGARVLEPTCGAGGMVIAHVRALRVAGLDANSCQYVLGDIDPLAVALAGVNVSAHGLAHVQLHVGDALASEPVLRS